MPGQHQPDELALFADFKLDVCTGELSRGDAVQTRMSEQPLQILITLLNRPGELVTREQLREKMWPNDTVVEFEHSINAAINRLRVVLGDSARNPQFIETLSRKGYRWKTPVEWRVRASCVGTTGPEELPAVGATQRLPPVRLEFRRWLLVAAVLVIVVSALVFSLGRNATSKTRTIANWRQRQLTVNSIDNPVGGGAISPDGKFLAYTDFDGMRVRPLNGNDSVKIADPVIYDRNPPAWEVGYWLPDSRHFFAIAELPREPSALWLLSTTGEPARQLGQDANPWRVTADGLVALTVKGDHEIWELDPKTGAMMLLLRGGETDRYRAVTWSPDGLRLAFIHNERTARGNESHIEVLDRKSHVTSELASGAGIRSVSELDEGFQDLLWFSADRVIFVGGEPDIRGVSCNLWQIKLDTKTAAALSAPERITNWAGFCVTGLSSTPDGRKLVYSRSSDSMNVLISDYDPARRAIRPPRRLTLTEDLSYTLAWAEDSATIYFQSNRLGKAGVFRQALDRTDAATVFSATGQIANLTLSPDKQWILFQRRDSANEGMVIRLSRVPVSGGSEQELLRGAEMTARCGSSAHARCVLAEVPAVNNEIVFSEFDPQLGKGRELGNVYRSEAGEVRWSLSPDGTQVALLNPLGGYFDVLSFEDQKIRRVSISPAAHLRSVNWSEAGDGFFACSAISKGSELLFVDLKGNARKLWELNGGEPFLQAHSSPDGKHLAIDATSKSANLWVLEDF